MRQAGETSWTKRVDDKSSEAAKFTVAAKLGQNHPATLFEGGARPQAPSRRVFRPEDAASESRDKTSVEMEEDDLDRKKIVLDFVAEKKHQASSITAIDDGFESFFASTTTSSSETTTVTKVQESVEMTFDDLPGSSSMPQLLTGVKRNLPKITRKAPASRNPVKADLAAESVAAEKESSILERGELDTLQKFTMQIKQNSVFN